MRVCVMHLHCKVNYRSGEMTPRCAYLIKSNILINVRNFIGVALIIEQWVGQ